MKTLLLTLLLPAFLYASGTKKDNTRNIQYGNDCYPGTASAELAINNVRTHLRSNGDMWWATQKQGGYVVPNVQGNNSSVFSGGALWIGGTNPGGALKLAARTNMGGGSDYYPGPLTEDGSTDFLTCQNWDRLFTVHGDSIRNHINTYIASCDNNGDNCTYDCDRVPLELKAWPGRGNPHFAEVHGFHLPNTTQGLAPFYDWNGDGIYDPCTGDYPDVPIENCNYQTAHQYLPDQIHSLFLMIMGENTVRAAHRCR